MNVKTNRLLVGALVSSVFLCGVRAADFDFRADFAEPPRSDHPAIYYYRSQQISNPEALKLDMEAYAAAGLSEVLLGHLNDLDQNYHLDESMRPWMQQLVNSLHEHGMTLSIFNMPGWSGSGGPWIDYEAAAKKFVFSRIRVRGPVRIDRKLPGPRERSLSKMRHLVYPFEEILDSYRDFAVLAVRVKSDPSTDPQLQSRVVRRAGDGGTTSILENEDGANGPLAEDLRAGEALVFDYEKPVTVRSLTIAPDVRKEFMPKEGTVLALDESGKERPIADFEFPERSHLTVSFPPVTAKTFKLEFRGLMNHSWADVAGGEARSGRFSLESVVLRARPMVDHLEWRNGDTGKYWLEIPDNFDGELPDGGGLDDSDVIDLTGNLGDDGTLRASLPEGEWVILRMGYMFNGKFTHPARTTQRSYECDKLDPIGIETHFEGYVEPYVRMIRELSPAPGDILTRVHIDSWEQGSSNWTPALPEYFKQRRGYDLRPYLPVLAGELVGSRKRSRRFLWDFRRTLADLVAEHYYGRADELSAGLGLTFSVQAMGPKGRVSDELLNLGQARVPHCEFWYRPNWNPRWPTNGRAVKAAASAMRLYGGEECRAESFSSWEYFREHPRNLKSLGDVQLASGLLGFELHVGIAQTLDTRAPGRRPIYGTDFNRFNTWWPHFGEFTSYLARCRTLLRRGVFQADVLWYIGDGLENTYAAVLEEMTASGYDFDFINTDRLRRLEARADGTLALPGAPMRYQMIALPDDAVYTAESLRLLEGLVENGARLLGNPPDRFTSLSEYPESRDTCREIVGRLWGGLDEAGDRKTVGNGQVIRGTNADAALAASGLEPDVRFENAPADTFRFLHRRDGETDLYFLVNQSDRPVRANVSLRVAEGTVSLWDPVRGSIHEPGAVDQAAGRTILPIHFAPLQSLFVVVSPPDARIDSVGRPLTARLAEASGETLPLPGAWEVEFERPDGTTFERGFARLESWTEHQDEEVRHFSGSARYRKDFTLETGDLSANPLYLDLGRVEALCVVRVNGQSAGVLWCPPYALDISGYVREGSNSLEVEVINTWFNRLARDIQLPPGERALDLTHLPPVDRMKGKINALDPMPSGLLGPVRLVPQQATDSPNMNSQ